MQAGNKIYIVASNYEYDALFSSIGEIVHNISEATLVVFTGGEDVSPHLYGDRAHPFTRNCGIRDYHESTIYHDVLSRDIPMVGICRGGQFLNVMNGGRMYQHVTRHGREHLIKDAITGEKVLVSSTHHQMMLPSPKALLVASSHMHGSREWYEGESYHEDVSEEDIEVLFYRSTKCLCFQPHPEFCQARYIDMKNYFISLLKRYGMVK